MNSFYNSLSKSALLSLVAVLFETTESLVLKLEEVSLDLRKAQRRAELFGAFVEGALNHQK